MVKEFLSRQVAATALRLVLAALGGWLAGKGLISEEAWTAAIPQAVEAILGVFALIGVMWSLWTSTRTQLVKRADSLPGVIAKDTTAAYTANRAGAGLGGNSGPDGGGGGP